MNIREVKEEIENAERTLRLADLIVEYCVDIVVGRLKKATKCSQNKYDYCKKLATLKKELKNFNMKTLQWEDK